MDPNLQKGIVRAAEKAVLDWVASASLTPGKFNLKLARACAGACERAYVEQTMGSALAHCLVVDGKDGKDGKDGNDGATIIAFRGTAEAHDWVTDIDVRWVNTGAGRVHEGFWRAAQSIIDQVRKLDQRERPVPVVLTGHSLGGALAVLVAWLLARDGKPVAGVVTFGGPRVGDWGWFGSYNETLANYEGATLGDITWRIVNAEDIVARVPSWLTGHRHVGREVFLPTIGAMRIRCALWFKLLSDIAGTLAAWSQGRGVAQLYRHPMRRYSDRVTTI